MTKISVTGKGGAGKSVFTTLFAHALVENGYTVLIVDSDESNPGLYRMLGFNKAPRDLIDWFGGEKRIMKTSPKSSDQQEKSDRPKETLAEEKMSLQNIPSQYLIGEYNLKLATVGKITVGFESCACPLAEALKIFLDKLILNEREVLILDMEAGVEHFGRGVEKKVDTIFIVVEPSFESIALAGKINLLAKAVGVRNIWAVMNKVANDTIGQKLRNELAKRGVPVIGSIPYDEQISESCLEGKTLEGGKAKESIRNIASSLHSCQGV